MAREAEKGGNNSESNLVKLTILRLLSLVFSSTVLTDSWHTH